MSTSSSTQFNILRISSSVLGMRCMISGEVMDLTIVGQHDSASSLKSPTEPSYEPSLCR
jgi:hypothetical protein